MQLCHNGIWHRIMVDDQFPCINNELAFAHSVDNELWAPLLEKGYAKLHGSYLNIEAGYSENVFRDLTGAPSEVIFTSQNNM